MLFVILNTQTENGEIKRADQREAVSRKNWSRNGRKATQTERKPTVFVILDCRSRQCIVGGVVGIISVIVGVALKMNNNAIAIIGGVDGPTSVFVAGKLNSVLVSILLIAIGVVMLIVAIIFYFLKKK